MKISELLMYGCSNALPLSRLEHLTGLNGRVVRQMMERERLSGVPILSETGEGYFLAETEEERKKFVESMRQRASAILRVADAVEAGEAVVKTAQELSGQQRLEGA